LVGLFDWQTLKNIFLTSGLQAAKLMGFRDPEVQYNISYNKEKGFTVEKTDLKPKEAAADSLSKDSSDV